MSYFVVASKGWGGLRRRTAAMVAGTFLVLMAGTTSAQGAGRAASATRPAKAQEAGSGAPAEKVIDEGTFVVSVEGRRAGQEFFRLLEIGEQREIRSRSHVASSGVTNIVRGQLRTDDKWRPLSARFDWQGRGANRRFTLKKEGGFPELVTERGARSVLYTRPGRDSDLFFLNNPALLGHLYPLCAQAGDRERTLTAFPAAPLRISAAELRPFPQTKLGAPALELRSFVADLAQSARFELVCDGTRLVALHQVGRGLTAVRASYEAVGSALESRARMKPSLPAGLAELPRRIAVPAAPGVPPTVLGCLLTVPAEHAATTPTRRGKLASPSSAPLPALLLLGDAGLHDRDGDPVGPGDPKLSMLKRLAIALAEGGVASLRCDDRGVSPRVASVPRPTLDTLAADARAMLAVLRRETAVDPERLALLGHGEGGLVAALAGERDARLKALTLLATPGRPLDVVIVEQSEATLRRFGYPDEEIRTALAVEQAVHDALRNRKPLPSSLSPAERKSLRQSSAWLRSHLTRDPAALVSRFAHLPVMLAVGGRDLSVATRDQELLRESLEKAGNKQVSAKLYPELNHAFATAMRGSLTDYMNHRTWQSRYFATWWPSSGGFWPPRPGSRPSPPTFQTSSRRPATPTRPGPRPGNKPWEPAAAMVLHATRRA